MWVRKAFVKWAGGSESEEISAGEGTVVSVPDGAEWYLVLIVDHVEKSSFNKSNFRVSFPGLLEASLFAFQLRPRTGYPVDDDPELEGDSRWYTLVVTWKPAVPDQNWVETQLDGDVEVPIHVDLHYSADGIVQSAAKFAFVLKQLP